MCFIKAALHSVFFPHCIVTHKTPIPPGQEARGTFHRADRHSEHKIQELLFYDVFHQGCFPLSLVSIKVNQLGAEGMLQQLSNMSNGWYEPYYHICYKYFSIIFNFSNRHSKSAAQPPRENTSDILPSATLNTSRYPAAAKVVQQLQTLHISQADILKLIF